MEKYLKLNVFIIFKERVDISRLPLSVLFAEVSLSKAPNPNQQRTPSFHTKSASPTSRRARPLFLRGRAAAPARAVTVC